MSVTRSLIRGCFYPRSRVSGPLTPLPPKDGHDVGHTFLFNPALFFEVDVKDVGKDLVDELIWTFPARFLAIFSCHGSSSRRPPCSSAAVAIRPSSCRCQGSPA